MPGWSYRQNSDKTVLGAKHFSSKLKLLRVTFDAGTEANLTEATDETRMNCLQCKAFFLSKLKLLRVIFDAGSEAYLAEAILIKLFSVQKESLRPWSMPGWSYRCNSDETVLGAKHFKSKLKLLGVTFDAGPDAYLAKATDETLRLSVQKFFHLICNS